MSVLTHKIISLSLLFLLDLLLLVKVTRGIHLLHFASCLDWILQRTNMYLKSCILFHTSTVGILYGFMLRNTKYKICRLGLK